MDSLGRGRSGRRVGEERWLGHGALDYSEWVGVNTYRG